LKSKVEDGRLKLKLEFEFQFEAAAEESGVLEAK
jgi:hypothetical protein